MRTTLDLPDVLFRRLKSRAAIEGLSLKDLLTRYVTAGLCGTEDDGTGRVADGAELAAPTVTAYDLMKAGAGAARTGIPDLATNPRHLDDFGRD